MKMKYLIKQVIMLVAVTNSLLIAEEGFNLLATMSGDSVGDEFCNVAGVGDVNGDSYPDVLVGAPGGEYAKLYFGGASFDTIPDLIFRDEKEYTRFGCSVAGDGDVNGDGYRDIVIGASSTWIGPSWHDCRYIAGAGAAYVYFGGSGMDTIPDLELVVANWDEQVGWYYGFGKAVAIAGDMNGDGYDDIVVSAPHDDYDAHGRIFIYYGGTNIDTQYDVLLEGEDHFDEFGYSISDVGDINHDGFDDVLIGAPQVLTENPGKAYLVYGSNEINLSEATICIGDSSKYNNYYGLVVAGLGDINGDEYPDFGIMASDYIQIFSGEDQNILFEIYDKLEQYGSYRYLNGCNLNNDNYQDILVGLTEPSIQYAGELNIYLGAVNPDTIPDYFIQGQKPHHYFGSTICNCGDVNNDGNNDVAIGEISEDAGPGSVYFYSFFDPDKIERSPDFPNEYQLYQNYPNPFNFATKINYYLPTSCNPRLTVYDITGREIAVLIDKYQTKGTYSICWNAAQYPSGIYVYRLFTENITLATKKMLLIK